MAKPGDVIEEPLFGERIVFRKTGRETGGELLEFDHFLPPGAFPPAAHVHPRQEQRLEVLEGSVRVRVGRIERIATKGDVVVVPPGTPHTWWGGDAPAVLRNQFRPALNTGEFFETLYGLARGGKTDRKGMPNLLRVSLLAPRFEIYLARPPIAVQKALFALLAPLARALGLDREISAVSARVHAPAAP